MPFIALTEGEGHLDFSGVMPGDDGWITYATPGPYDRYPDMDILLARTDHTVPSGRPDGNVLSPYRSDRFVPFHDERTASAAVATRYVCDLQRVTEANPSHIAELAHRRPPLVRPRGASAASAQAAPQGARPERAAVAGRTA